MYSIFSQCICNEESLQVYRIEEARRITNVVPLLMNISPNGTYSMVLCYFAVVRSVVRPPKCSIMFFDCLQLLTIFNIIVNIYRVSLAAGVLYALLICAVGRKVANLAYDALATYILYRCAWCSVHPGWPRDKGLRRVRTWPCWCVRRQTLSSHIPARSRRWSSLYARRLRHTSSWSRIRRRQRPAGGSLRPISACAHGLSRLLFRLSSCVRC